MKFNLKGFVVGNGCADWKIDVQPAFVDTWHRFNLLPANLVKQIKDNKCELTFKNAFPFKGKDRHLCIKLLTKMYRAFNTLNIYDLSRKNYNVKPGKSVSTTEEA